MTKNLLKQLYLRSSLFHANRGNLRQARANFSTASSMETKISGFMNAYDARLLMLEGQHGEAKVLFRKVIESIQDSDDANAVYTDKFCRFMLALYEQDAKARELKSEASQLEVEKKYRRFLPFLSGQTIKEILEH